MLLCSTIATAQNLRLQPQPQQVVTNDKRIDLPETYLLIGEAEANATAVKLLKSLLTGKQQHPKGFQICIGERGDKAVRPFQRMIPNQPEGYYLKIDSKQLVLAGNDERGTYYALQTLAQLLKENQLPEAEITDFPAIRFRGVVEGFYGTPWSHEARLSQLRFYGDNKLNTYIYGPKDDPYHSSPNWRLPYPEKEATQLAELVQTAHDNEVDFVWAIHPGQDIQWNQTDRDLLMEKFEKMYQLGVRSFAVFFDDISGEGTNPERQAELLNYLDDRFVKVKKDVTPLVMCPTEYNRSWANPAKGYLPTLGKKLNPSVQIMWTGDRVVADITSEGTAWVNKYIQRPAYIWWNFPVSDYVRDHLLMGAVYGNDTETTEQMSGFVSNPMEHAEASKIAIYCVADYAWNPKKYNSQQAWERAIEELLPQAPEALKTFASHSSDLGKTGHGYRRDESTVVQPIAERFIQNLNKGAYDESDFAALQNEFAKISESADILLINKGNEPLIEEITPWLHQFKLVGETGSEALALLKAEQENNPALFLRKYHHIQALQQLSFGVDQTYNQNPHQPGVKIATKVMQPLIDNIFTYSVEAYNRKYNRQLSSTVSFSPHQLLSDIPQIKNLPLQIKTNRVILSPALEVIKWQPGGSFTIELDNAYPGKSAEIDFGQKDVAVWGQLELLTDGGAWQKVEYTQKDNRIVADLQKTPLRAIRFTNTGKEEQEIYLRKFIVTISTDTTQVIDRHNAENSLDYLGVYKGTTPAADCPGIEQTLVLNKDRTFTLNMIYIDRPGADFTESGTFTIDGNILTTQPKNGESSYYKVEEGRVRMLMKDKQPVTGALAEHYVLVKE